MPVGAKDRVSHLESATRLFWAAENGCIACMSSTLCPFSQDYTLKAGNGRFRSSPNIDEFTRLL